MLVLRYVLLVILKFRVACIFRCAQLHMFGRSYLKQVIFKRLFLFPLELVATKPPKKVLLARTNAIDRLLIEQRTEHGNLTLFKLKKVAEKVTFFLKFCNSPSCHIKNVLILLI